MSSEKSGSSILASRDRRGEILHGCMAQGHTATVFLTLNIPGKEKKSQGIYRLFSWSTGLFSQEFPDAEKLADGDDALGPFAIFALNREPVDVKRRCIQLENSFPASRLMDLDVFDKGGCQVGRFALGMEPRRCLLCAQPAVECIRLKRHPVPEVTAKTDELLTTFRN